jgi:hypothetical protein
MFFQQHRKYLLVFLLCAVDLLSATNPHGSQRRCVCVHFAVMDALVLLLGRLPNLSAPPPPYTTVSVLMPFSAFPFFQEAGTPR